MHASGRGQSGASAAFPVALSGSFKMGNELFFGRLFFFGETCNIVCKRQSVLLCPLAPAGDVGEKMETEACCGASLWWAGHSARLRPRRPAVGPRRRLRRWPLRLRGASEPCSRCWVPAQTMCWPLVLQGGPQRESPSFCITQPSWLRACCICEARASAAAMGCSVSGPVSPLLGSVAAGFLGRSARKPGWLLSTATRERGGGARLPLSCAYCSTSLGSGAG